MPELSIVIPVYNGEKYIRKCYEGIASQVFKDWEAICFCSIWILNTTWNI